MNCKNLLHEKSDVRGQFFKLTLLHVKSSMNDNYRCRYTIMAKEEYKIVPSK